MRTMNEESYGMILYSTTSGLYQQTSAKITDGDAKKKKTKKQNKTHHHTNQMLCTEDILNIPKH